MPMLVSGKGVTLQNQFIDEQINVCDLFATMAHFSDESIGEKGGLYNSLSFKHLLSGEDGPVRKYNYMELGAKDGFPDDAYTIREAQYKMIQFLDTENTQELYDLKNDPYETNNLLSGTLTVDQQEKLKELETEANRIRTSWSCNDGILNGDEIAIDCGGDCGSCEVTNLPDFLHSEEFALFPNPFENHLTLNSFNGTSAVVIEVFNTSGKKIDQLEKSKTDSVIIKTEDYFPGIYLISVFHIESQTRKVYKLIKR